MWRNVRILILLLILLVVALSQYLDRVRSTDWDTTLRVAVIPIRADDSTTTASYIGQLTPAAFTDPRPAGGIPRLVLLEPARPLLGLARG